MRRGQSDQGGGPGQFFWLIASYNSLENWYRTNYTLMHHENWSLGDLERLIPWEREIYVALAMEQAEKENEP